MAINTSKVVAGGLAAGVVSNIIGFLGFGVLRDRASRQKRLPLRQRCRAAE